MCENHGDELIPEERDRALDDLNLALGRYMIALAGAFQGRHHDGDPNAPARFFCFPGFVLAIRDRRIFVTAGHNLQALKKEYGEKYTEWTGMVWVQFVPDSEVASTLAVDNSVARRIDCECNFADRSDCSEASGTADWGVLELTAKEWQWMEASGVRPFSLDDMKTEYDADGYILIGLPTELFDQLRIENGRAATSSVDPTIIGIRKRDDLIERENGYWFVGNLPEALKINIHGMSGGPLFAINVDSWEIWIVGVQSHWCPQNRIAFVCPVKTILDQLPDHLRS